MSPSGARRFRHVPVDGRRPARPWEFLVKDVPDAYHHDINYLVEQLDWEKNVDPEFKNHNYLEPINRSGGHRRATSTSGSSTAGRLQAALQRLRADGRARPFDHDQGSGGLRPDRRAGQRLDREAGVDSPNFIRFGEVTEDEVFVTAKRAGEGVLFHNSGSEPFVSLRYFGPDVHADLPAVGDHAKKAK